MPPADVPAELRIAAGFALAKRVKLAGGQIATAVDTDAEFRRHLATQVRALAPRVVSQLESRQPVSEDELPEAAAIAYLTRIEGWPDVVAADAALEIAQQRADSNSATVSRLTSALATARADAERVRAKSRLHIDQLKADNTQLRRTLGETRGKLKNAEGASEAAQRDRDGEAHDARLQLRALHADVRRLRAKVAELEVEGATERRSRRGERDAESMRLRLLLDTVTQAVSGLRRELALPPSDVLPADTVASLPSGGDSILSRTGQALADDDPALLRRLLELPKVHLIIDGYNVSKTAWPNAPLAHQRDRLTRGVAALAGGKVIEVTVVFDGADLTAAPPVATPRGVRVLFSPAGVTADDVIAELVAVEPTGRPIVVVSSDREVAHDATGRGARSIASLALVRALS
ncbi:MAG: NYN domain-containing protein [Nocardioidaceae bacterium]|nr:NYN domain-containing protein [Nocardioidaceae bacterium]